MKPTPRVESRLTRSESSPEPVSMCCGQTMEAGCLVDAERLTPVTCGWLKGTPKKARGFSLSVSRIQPEDSAPVQVFRCSACGRLEFFARPGRPLGS